MFHLNMQQQQLRGSTQMFFNPSGESWTRCRGRCSFARGSSSVGRLTATSSAACAPPHARELAPAATAAAAAARLQHGPTHSGPPAAGHQHLQERPGALHTPAHQAIVPAEQDTVRTQQPSTHPALGLLGWVFCLCMPGLGTFEWLVAKVSSSTSSSS